MINSLTQNIRPHFYVIVFDHCIQVFNESILSWKKYYAKIFKAKVNEQVLFLNHNTMLLLLYLKTKLYFPNILGSILGSLM